MDPNCEKMFDNGNFRRKRKRRADSLKPDDASGGKLADTASMLGVTQRSPSPPESKSITPPTTEPSPCFSSFVSTMNSVMVGNLDAGIRSRDSGGALMADFTRGRDGASALSSYQPGESSPTLDHMSHRLSYYTTGFGSSISNHFSVNNLIYSREGTEV